jgi:hypothetical protein
MRAFVSEVRCRLGAHALAILAWPLVSLLMAAVELRELPYYAVTPWQALLGASAGVAVLAKDFAVIALAALAASTLVFAALAAARLVPPASRRALAAEPAVLFLGTLFGLALYYPAVVAHPVLTFARALPVAAVIAGLGIVTVLAAMLRAGAARGVAVGLVALGIGVTVPRPVTDRWLATAIGPGQAPLVVLGLDSLSHADDLAALRALVARHDGVEYPYAVSPGLLTNAVWTSILLMQPVHAHGVFHTFQRFPTAADTLVTRARRAGFRTVSVFPDQITCAVGSQAGFDEDRSGPVGWRQLATQTVENASLLLPVVRPLLPQPLRGSVPANHAGTFAYDLDRELDDIFGEGSTDRRAFMAAHLTYLHSPRYPQWAELTREERTRVRRTPAGEIHDRSFDWQDRHAGTDAIPLRPWKVRRLTQAVVAAVERTRFFSPERGGQLVLLSDHGDRAGLAPDTFWRPEYHHVPLVTFGLPAHRDVEAPISLVDTASLLFLASGEAPRDPSVEFIVSAPAQWPQLVRSVRLGWDGSVDLDERLLAGIFAGLRAHRPWPAEQPVRLRLVFGHRAVR